MHTPETVRFGFVYDIPRADLPPDADATEYGVRVARSIRALLRDLGLEAATVRVDVDGATRLID